MRAGLDVPLARTFAAVEAGADAAYGLTTQIGLPGVDGSVVAAELLCDEAAIASLLRRTCASAGTDRRDIAGGYLHGRWGYVVLVRAVAALLVDRRVPRLDHAAIGLHPHPGGWFDGLAFAGPFACLPGDPDAGDAAATVLPGEAALLQHLRDAFAAHQAPLVEAIHTASRRPRSALWRTSADTLADAFMHAGEALGRRAEAWEWGRAAVAGAEGRLAGTADYRVWRHAGEEEVSRIQAQCCLSYRCADAIYCFDCPLIDDAQRLAKLAERASGG